MGCFNSHSPFFSPIFIKNGPIFEVFKFVNHRELFRWYGKVSNEFDKTIECFYYSSLYCNDANLLSWVSAYGHTKIVKILLDDPRIDPSADNNIAIRNASRNGYTDIVKLLLTDDRVDPSKPHNIPLYNAVSCKNDECIKYLLMDKRVGITPCILDELVDEAY